MSISLYIALYYNLLLLLVVYIAIQPVRAETVRQPYINNQIFSLALLLIVYVHVTFRPTDYHYFGDTSEIQILVLSILPIGFHNSSI